MRSTAPQITRSKWMILALLALLTLLAVFPALAEESVQTAALEMELYQCGGLPKETSRASRYALMSDGVDIETYLVSQLRAQAATIDVQAYQIPIADLGGLFGGILNNHPELFYVKNGWEYSYGNNGVVYTIRPKYKYSGAELQSRINGYNAELSRIVSYASSANSTLGKILLVNDYFCVNYQYDGSYSRYAADELFIEKKGVCQAYMMGFRAVMDRLGISCLSATSEAMNHTWNMVRLDGSWYHIDVTWNDPTPNMPYRACHNNFLLSNSGIQTTGHYDWTSTASAGSAKYDSFFWREIGTPMSVSGNRIYYAVQSANSAVRFIKYWNIGGAYGEVCGFEAYGSYYRGYSPVQLVGNLLCYATCNQLYLYDPSQDKAKLIYELEDSSCFIVTGYYSNNEMHICAADADGNKYVISVPIEAMPVITLSESQLLLEAENGALLTARVENVYNPPAVTWTSDAPDVADVDELGQVTGYAPGRTIITATCGELSAVCEVVVYQFTFEDLDGQTLPQGHTYLKSPPALPEEVGETGWNVVSTAPEVARVNADYSFTTLAGGSAKITVQSKSYPKIKREMTITVPELAQIALPAGLTTVEKEAFAGASFQRVNANAALKNIGSRAFADCTELKLVSLGGGVKEIADDAFAGCTDVAFLCPAGSYAATYAETHGLTWSDSGEK